MGKEKHRRRSLLELQDELVDLIIERLPLSDYARFAAVSRKFRSLRKSHRLRFHPRPPPNPLLPWLLPVSTRTKRSTITCPSPFEGTAYHLNLKIPRGKNTNQYYILRDAGAAHGWALLLPTNTTYEACPVLFNPISSLRIQLPPCKNWFTLTVSSSPSPPDPSCSVLAIDPMTTDSLFLLRLGQLEWTPLSMPQNLLPSDLLLHPYT